MEWIDWYAVGWEEGYDCLDYNPPDDPFFEKEYRNGYRDGVYDWEDDNRQFL